MAHIPRSGLDSHIKQRLAAAGCSCEDPVTIKSGGVGSTIYPLEIYVTVDRSKIESDSLVIVYELDKEDPNKLYELGENKGNIVKGVTVKTDRHGASGSVTVRLSGIFANVNVSLKDQAKPVKEDGFVITTTL